MALQAWHIMKEKISMAPETSAHDIVLKMIASGLAAIPVVNESQEVLGIVTEHAVLGALWKGLNLEQVSAGSLLAEAPLTAGISTSPEELSRMMHQNNCCSVVVIVNKGKYAGVVSRHMLMDIYTSPHYARFAQKDRKAPFLCQ